MHRSSELCEVGGGPGFSFPATPFRPTVTNKPYAFRGRKAPWKKKKSGDRAQEPYEEGGGPGLL